jgi:ATP-dependent Clp protease ATP-binding subunit ClpA
MFDTAANKSIERATALARRKGHEYVCLEHLLFAILEDEEGQLIVTALHGDFAKLKKRLGQFFEEHLTRVPPQRRVKPCHTIALQRVIDDAFDHVSRSSAEEHTVGDLLAAILAEPDCHASFYLQEQGITRLRLLEFISHCDEIAQHLTSPTFLDTPMTEGDKEGGSRSAHELLAIFAVDLNQKAREGRIDPLIGREAEVERAIQDLCRRNKNNPLFVGNPGVGKTQLVEGLAQRIVDGKVPARLSHLHIFSLDMGSLTAGTEYRGQFEQRLKGIIQALEAIPGAVLYLDEIHTVVGAGGTRAGSLDAANMLKPVLVGGKIRFIGSTTFDEYKNHFSKDPALVRRFLKIDLPEPSVAETILILKGLQSRFEAHHGITYASEALQTAAELAGKYINDRFLPDKAIDVIDEAGAVAGLRGDPMVTTLLVEQIVAKIARIPEKTVSTTDKDRLRTLECDLRKVVFGQDAAISAITKAIHRSRAGLSFDQKPVGSFLFVGPTGVGKTELCRQLAKSLGVELLRFDMSEYMEKHAVSRLIGAPPGYVGFEQGGLLTDAIIRHPHAVLLLDEIEKAHPDLFNVLLQVMDNAVLTDTSGRKADFRNVILIMTSNAGSDDMYGKGIGFQERPAQQNMGAVDRLFRPEFRNRLDMLVKFEPLPRNIVGKIVDKYIDEIRAKLASQNVAVEITEEARAWIAEKGYSPHYGARSIGRLIQSEVKDKLAEALLFGQLGALGGAVTIDLDENRLVVSQKSDACASTAA